MVTRSLFCQVVTKQASATGLAMAAMWRCIREGTTDVSKHFVSHLEESGDHVHSTKRWMRSRYRESKRWSKRLPNTVKKCKIMLLSWPSDKTAAGEWALFCLSFGRMKFHTSMLRMVSSFKPQWKEVSKYDKVTRPSRHLLHELCCEGMYQAERTWKFQLGEASHGAGQIQQDCH